MDATAIKVTNAVKQYSSDIGNVLDGFCMNVTKGSMLVKFQFKILK